MALTGTTNEQKIWNYLKAQGLNACGAAGLMGNLYAESGLSPTNLQNTFEKRLGYTDTAYTEAVDSGAYANFAKDSAGYGLAQWTYWSRKANLLSYAQAAGKSIGDLEMQLAFLMKELKESYASVLSALKTAASVREASDIVLTKFERPADQSEAAKIRRAGYGQGYYDKYAGSAAAAAGSTGTTGGESMSNSPLVTYTRISKNRNSPRNHDIDTITIHCYVGQVTAKRGCDYFATTDRGVSANYVVGYDGSIGLSVEEKDRSWCSGGRDKNGNPILVNGISGSDNDHRAITIEVASDTDHPYAVTEKAFSALIELCIDICKRNGIKKLLWKGDKSLVGRANKQNMTVHRWFANKACPGDYLYNRMGEIADTVNKRLGTATSPAKPSTPSPAPGSNSGADYAIGDIVTFTGTKHYASSGAAASTGCKAGTAKVTQVAKGAKHPYHLIRETGGGSTVYGWVDAADISGKAGSAAAPASYKVRVTAAELNIRTGPGTNYGTNGSIKDKGVYTIVSESAGPGATLWGELKSGAGWISLDYCTKL